jgi:formate/nitrite transporter FocA (FNT family)
MLPVLQFIFQDFWHFAGTLALIWTIGFAGAMTLAPLAGRSILSVTCGRKCKCREDTDAE